MTRQEILDQCKIAANTLKKWEKNLIENSLKPQWEKPREIIKVGGGR